MHELERWLKRPDLTLMIDPALRLARRVPAVQAVLEGLLDDPIARALAGLPGPAPVAGSLRDRVRLGIAAVDGGSGIPDPGALEEAARHDPAWWVPAARIHALTVPERERAGRMALSEQSIPYVFPGDLHPMQVEIFAVGDRVLPALHVDWVRKLSGLAVEAVRLDCASLGMWTLPLLDVLDSAMLIRTLTSMRRLRRLPPGGVGLAAIYLERLGRPAASLLAAAGPTDRLLLDLARAARSRVG